MHNMENTPKIITIIGLVVEGIVFIIISFTWLLFSNIDKMYGLGSAAEADLTVEEYNDLMSLLGMVEVFFLVMAIILLAMFLINIYLFIKLLAGKFTNEQAKKVYLYQAIWGGISLLFNQITGILYLISGVQGYNDRSDKVDVRDGI